MKKIGILTSGGDCGGLNAAVRSIFFRAKNTYGMEVLGIQDGTVGLMQRPVAFLPLDYQTFSGSLLRQGGTFLGTTNKGCLLYTSPSPRDQRGSRMASSG